MRRPLLFVNVVSGQMTAVCLPASRDIVERLSLDGDIAAQVTELRKFLSRFARKRPIVVGLVERHTVLFASMRLPTLDLVEACAMARLQFSRTTPHATEDLVVDAVVAQPDKNGAIFECVMATRQSLQPLTSVLSETGLVPQMITALPKESVSGHASVGDWTDVDWKDFAHRWDRKCELFDLRSESDRRQDGLRRLRKRLFHLGSVLVLSGIVFLAPDVRTLWVRTRQLAQLTDQLKPLEASAEKVSEQEQQLRLRQEHLDRRFTMARLSGALASAMPGEIRLEEVFTEKDGTVSLRGVASEFSDVDVFRAALTDASLCRDLKVEELGQQVAESGDQVIFRLSCREVI